MTISFKPPRPVTQFLFGSHSTIISRPPHPHPHRPVPPRRLSFAKNSRIVRDISHAWEIEQLKQELIQARQILATRVGEEEVKKRVLLITDCMMMLCHVSKLLAIILVGSYVYVRSM